MAWKMQYFQESILSYGPSYHDSRELYYFEESAAECLTDGRTDGGMERAEALYAYGTARNPVSRAPPLMQRERKSE